MQSRWFYVDSKWIREIHTDSQGIEHYYLWPNDSNLTNTEIDSRIPSRALALAEQLAAQEVEEIING